MEVAEALDGKAGWQSGYAEDCKSFYIGSIPVPASKYVLFRLSSAVEQSAVNRLVVGSNPTAGAIQRLANLAQAFFIFVMTDGVYTDGRYIKG